MLSVALVHGRRCLGSTTTRRTLSSVLPTRHSRHLPPPVCRDAVELDHLTHSLVNCTFVEYDVSQEDDLWLSNDTIIQTAEYTIRGHAARIPNTLYWKEQDMNASQQDSSQHQPPEQHVSSMQAILNRLQEQNHIYMTLRKQLQSQLVTSSWSTSTDDESNDASPGSNDSEESTTTQTHAGPGPTVEMWDTLLDSMAVTGLYSPEDFKTTFESVLTRHVEDGGPELNTNPYTVPTILTFNAVLRGVANVEYPDDDDNNNNYSLKTRDDALELAFGLYDEMRWHVDRNSATFCYMLNVVKKFLPPSRSRGNIAHGLWTQATRHHVASSQVLEALHQAHSPSNGEEFDDWLQQHRDIKATPLAWRREHRLRRYSRNDATY